MKVTISKQTAEGEFLSLEFSVNDQKDLAKMGNAYTVADTRMIQLNERYLRDLKIIELFPPRYHAALRILARAVYYNKPELHEQIPGLLPKEEAEPSDAPQGS